jgi:nicotinamidase/pyrazinamidase
MMWPTHCVENTPGADFHPDLVRKPTDISILKGTDRNVDAYSGFNNPELVTDLKAKGVTQVYVVGLAWDYCVGSTAKDASESGFETFFMTDATRPVAAET